MEEISEQLDKVVLDIFQVLEDLYKKQSDLEQTMKDGFFTMARARYNMGVKRVSSDQFVDANLVANNTVEVISSNKDGTQCNSDKLQDAFVLHNTKGLVEESHSSKISDSNKKSSKDSDSSLRKRGAGMPSGDLGKEFQECLRLIDSDEDDKKIQVKNPLNLFGVLVPQALRSSQNSFEAAVKLSVDIANRKHELVKLQKKMYELKQEKSKLSSSDDSSRCVKGDS